MLNDMENNTKNTLLLASVGVLIGIVGMVSYHQQITWLLITCAALCVCQLLVNLFTRMLQDYTYPLLAVCIIVAYYITGNIIEGICYGLCLYYAIALLYIGLLIVIPFQFIMIAVPVTSIIAFFVNAEHLFVATGVFCTLNFIVTHLRGKTPSFAMDVFLWCLVFGEILLFQRDTDNYYFVKILKGILWAGAAYYVFGVLYAYHRVYIKKDKLTKDEF